MERKRIAEAAKGVGKPKVGGPFELVDQEGQKWSSEKMKGKFTLVRALQDTLLLRYQRLLGDLK